MEVCGWNREPKRRRHRQRRTCQRAEPYPSPAEQREGRFGESVSSRLTKTPQLVREQLVEDNRTDRYRQSPGDVGKTAGMDDPTENPSTTGGTAAPSTDNGAGPARGSWSWRVKSIYISLMRGLGRALTALRILPSEPPPREQRIRHWLVSLTRIYDSVAVAELGVPWWTYRASEAVDRWLSEQSGPIRVFEWGSGSSTIWLSPRVDRVITIEHHDEFVGVIGEHLDPLDNVEMRHVPAVPSATPRIPSAKKGNEGLDFFDYVHAIDAETEPFDLVVIDGRAREACLTAALPHVRPGGLIIFDDPHRARYRRAIDDSGLPAVFHRGLSPTIPYPVQTALLTAARPR